MNLEKVTEILLDKKSEIENEISSLGRVVDENGDWIAVPDRGDGETADELDNANLVEEFEENVAVFSILEERYSQIKKALDAIKNESYGVCSICGNNISKGRLNANPASTTCIEHAE